MFFFWEITQNALHALKDCGLCNMQLQVFLLKTVAPCLLWSLLHVCFHHFAFCHIFLFLLLFSTSQFESSLFNQGCFSVLLLSAAELPSEQNLYLQPDYVQPLVAVKLLLTKDDYNIDQTVECKVEGSHLRNNDDRDKYLGRVTFRVKVLQ